MVVFRLAAAKGVLQAVTLRAVVVNVVGGDQGNAGFAGQRRQLPVALVIPFQKVPLEFP